MTYDIVRVWHQDCWCPPSGKPQLPRREILPHRTYGATVKFLLSQTEKDGIWFWEHDVQASDTTFQMMKNILDKIPMEIIVAFPYFLYPATTGLDKPISSNRVAINERGKTKFLSLPESEFAWIISLFGMGCTYLPKMVGDLIDPNWDYPDFDSRLSMHIHFNHPEITRWSPPILADHPLESGGFKRV